MDYSVQGMVAGMGMKSKFPAIHNSGKAKLSGGNITFTWIDSLGKVHTDTKKLLSANEMAGMIEERMERFHLAGPGSRESEESRAERKHISAHPEKDLREVWRLLDEHGQMEMAMMLDMNSHHGISDPKWAKAHASRRSEIVGDDEQALS